MTRTSSPAQPTDSCNVMQPETLERLINYSEPHHSPPHICGPHPSQSHGRTSGFHCASCSAISLRAAVARTAYGSSTQTESVMKRKHSSPKLSLREKTLGFAHFVKSGMSTDEMESNVPSVDHESLQLFLPFP